MPNPRLTAAQLEEARKLLAEVRQRLMEVSGGDPLLLFAYRRKVAKELVYDERGTPAHRGKLKQTKWEEQGHLCAECREPLELARSELDRREAVGGYTAENTELVHAACHHRRQEAKRYS